LLGLLVLPTPAIAADPPASAPLARYFPRRDLVGYLEFDGIHAHSAAWNQTAAGKILRQTPTGAMLSSVATQILETILPAPGDGVPAAGDLVTLAEQVALAGFAFAVHRDPDDKDFANLRVGLVLRGAAKGPALATIRKLLTSAGLPAEALAKVQLHSGREATLLGPPEGPNLAWWAEGDDLAVSFLRVTSANAMIDTLEGREPSAVAHPTRLALMASEAGFEPVGVAFLDRAALADPAPNIAAFGIDGIKRVEMRWGYRGEALTCVTRVVAPSPRRGALALFDQPTFGPRTLPPLPEKVGTFSVVSVDFVRLHDALSSLARSADPGGVDAFAQLGDEVQLATGRRLREDILAQLGPRVVYAEVPTPSFSTLSQADGFLRGMARVPRTSLLIELRERDRFLQDLARIAGWLNASVPPPRSRSGRPGRPALPLIRPLKPPEQGYEIALSPTYLPLPAGYRPTILVGDHHVVIGTTPEVARRTLAGGGIFPPAVGQAVGRAPEGLMVLSLVDAADSALPEVVANIPTLIQSWAFALQGIPFGQLGAMVENAVDAVNPVVVPPPVAPVAPGPEAAVVEAGPVQPPARGVVSAPGPPMNVVVGPAAAPPAQVVVGPAAPAQAIPEAAPGPVKPAAPVDGFVAAGVVAPAGAKIVIGNGVNLFPFPVLQAVVQQAVAIPVMPEAGDAAPMFRLRLDPEEIPTPEEIRAHLFPGVYAIAVDAEGISFHSSESWPGANPTALAPLAIGVALPLYRDWQAQLRTDRVGANLKKIGAAVTKHAEDHDGRLPGPAIVDKAGKPLLSWRVAILPLLGQQALYEEFRRDEPWDSPHNKALVDRMPDVFQLAGTPAPAGSTFYRAITGVGTGFELATADGIKLEEFEDGTELSLLVVESNEAVVWTQPDNDLPADPNDVKPGESKLLPRLGGHQPGRFLALFADGKVKMIKSSLMPATLRAICTRSGGEGIDESELE
jgi:hypothetical protein